MASELCFEPLHVVRVIVWSFSHTIQSDFTRWSLCAVGLPIVDN